MDELSVKTLQELQGAVSTIFENALRHGHFVHVYAEMCAKLEIRCWLRDMVKTFSCDGLFHSSLEEEPPRKVAGPFESENTALDKLTMELHEAPSSLVDCGLTFVDGMIARLWQDQERKKYYFSGPIDIGGSFNNPSQATRSAKMMHPVRHALLRCCERELEVDTSEALNRDVSLSKKRKVGACRFLGALYRRKLVNEDTIHACIEMLLDIRQNVAGDFQLLKPTEMSDEGNLEAVCELLEAVGSLLETVDSDSRLSKYIWVLKHKVNAGAVSEVVQSRVKFLVDLRAKGWDLDAMEEQKVYTEITATVKGKTPPTS